MSKFIDNISNYIEHYKIKKNFISKKTGIEQNKLSRILNNIQDVNYEDMTVISKALNKDITYFMQESLILEKASYVESTSISFYMGAVDDGKKQLANIIFDFLENVDAIMGIQKKIDKDALEISTHEF